MAQISTHEFERLPLRVHSLMAGVPLHDVWSVDLPRFRAGVTLDEFLRSANNCTLDTCGCLNSSAIRALAPCADAAQHSVLSFRVVYRFENEQLIELINRTAHAAALSALVETPTAYRFYFAVYVHKLSLFTPFYMALIDPFRKLIVYPSLLRGIRTGWTQVFGSA